MVSSPRPSVTFPRPSFRFPLPLLAPALAGALFLGTGIAPPACAAEAGAAVATSPEGIWTVHRNTLRAAGREEAVSLPLSETAVVSSLATADDGWFVAGSVLEEVGAPLLETGTVRRLFVLAESEDGTARVLPTPRTVAPAQADPVLLTDHGELVGMAWLEGDGGRGMAVRAARWKGDHFSSPERVSEIGPGSQVALDGTVLADGAWLLTWAAYDGSDTEIVHAERRGGQWLGVEQISPPNETPDSSPTVLAVDGGALVAWSRYEDGTYQVVLRRFAGGEWGPMTRIGGSGTLNPDFQTVAGRPYLLFQQGGALEGGGRMWKALELDGEGRAVRQAVAAVRTTGRPVLSDDLSAFLEPGTERRGWRSRLRWTPVTGDAVAGGAR